ncbi:UDP-N-acetylglucosamine 2-epimerase (non-hydrolyzing) [Spirosoma sp. RP8]|uniref:UDP-N-acetylglucosamine 2-epimerase (Non-hydrolyzing) n=1 Tax=Spirosoma liriopis TaxID=2937440 RepID=A0ABT0HRV1_9BACT|nr:UDP-N-acetylglucosamine 2-epimerase (non-hydrolyzing) [Spirosoma liriopis]MCK8494910.1 UDP-N-acetylglucosamine 2-epimerase (non-hydrolyzing) [Spirosoma liriopis]
MGIKLITIIGARPQIIKASALSRAIRTRFAHQITEVLVHTGQHYDENMSGVFFDELAIPQPTYNLGVGSGNHGEQTGRMIKGIEEIVLTERPDFIVLYGDTNSTLAGAIAASKVYVPIVHIEAGLRSYNKTMPEEINRVLTDHVSTYLFSPTQTGVNNLIREGFRTDNQPPYTIDNPGVFNVGDIMYDNTLYFAGLAKQKTYILERLGVQPETYVLVTLHRNANTDDASRLNSIFDALLILVEKYRINLVMPLHPRTLKQMSALLSPELHQSISTHPAIQLCPPVSYLEMIVLEQHAKLIITDSGGVQKEAYFFKKPCIILRAETEWVEIVDQGAAVLCDADPNQILQAFQFFEGPTSITFNPIYGEGDAAAQLLNLLIL